MRRDRSLTLSQDSRPQNGVPAAKDHSSGKNLVNLGPETQGGDFGGPELTSGAFRLTLTTAGTVGANVPKEKVH